LLTALAGEVGMQDFDSCLCAQVQVFSQVDGSPAPSPDETEQAIVAKLLSDTVAHPRTSSGHQVSHAFSNDPSNKKAYLSQRVHCCSSEFATHTIRYRMQNFNIAYSLT
jgi:hypothetical protein